MKLASAIVGFMKLFSASEVNWMSFLVTCIQKHVEFVNIYKYLFCCEYDMTGKDIARAKQQASKGRSHMFLY